MNSNVGEKSHNLYWNNSSKKWEAVYPATESTLADIKTNTDTLVATTQLLTIVKALDVSSFNLASAPYSGSTNVSADYILDNIEFKFTTAESKTITVTTASGAVLFTETNTKTSVIIPVGQGYNSDENVTIAVTQTSGACSMNLIVRIRTGSTPVTGSLLPGKSAIRVAEDGTDTYVGVATPGANVASAVWAVYKVDDDGNVTWADGDSNNDNIWNNYLSLSYS